ncbi:hypothetical protein EG329_005214 [Mollisiaceae sp. DMI_Dod_QoI]|nr:hypothetical protein EG329_005214 [Helotiales sp. DMI_Dod_QoI]
MSSPDQTIGVNFRPVQSRKRARTQTLLGSEYEETVTSILDPPQPLQELSEYTSERVRKGLRYADTTLRHPHRKISPAGGIALQLYKDTCVNLLDLLDVDEGEVLEKPTEERKAIEDSHRVFLREMEKGMQISACMRVTNTNSVEELQQQLLSLQRTAFHGRYGDYFAEICNDLKVAAEKRKVAGWETLSKGYWSDTANRVEMERPIYDRHLKGESGLQEKMPTTYAIHVACYALGLHPGDTLQIVKEYGIRNDLLHANLLPMIKEGLFADLARRLYLDRIDILLLIPQSDEAGRRILEGLLDSMIDLWFDKDELDPGNHQMWTATSQLKSKYRELNASSPVENEAKINQEISKATTKAFKQNLRKSHREDELVEMFAKITGRKMPPKRVASSQLDAERERLAVRKKQWAAIMNLTNQAKSLHDAYILNGDGEIGEPRDIIKDKEL